MKYIKDGLLLLASSTAAIMRSATYNNENIYSDSKSDYA